MTSRNQNYISDELIHFAGSGLNKEEQYNTLCKILRCKAITHPPHYPDGSSVTTIRLSRKISENEMYNPDMICFCDIPVDNLSIHIKKYSPFGLSFYKNFIVQNSGCLVFYIPLKGKVATNIQKADYFDNMLKEYHRLCGYLEDLMKKHDHRPAFGLPQNFKRFYELQRFLAHQLFSYKKFLSTPSMKNIQIIIILNENGELSVN